MPRLWASSADRGGAERREGGRHEKIFALGIGNSVGNLLRALGHQTSPNGVALGPNVLAFVIKAPASAIDHDAKGDGVQARDDSTVEFRRAGVDGHGVTLRRIADRSGALFEQILQHHTLRIGRAANDEVCRGIAPIFAQPGDVGLKSAGGDHDGLWPQQGGDAISDDQDLPNHAADQAKRADLGIVGNAHAEAFSSGVIGVQEGFAAAQEERIGAGETQRAGQRRLKVRAMSLHPGQQLRRGADSEARQVFVGLAMGDAEQVLPIIGLGITANQGRRWRIVHEAKVARVAAIAAAKRAWRMLEQHDAGARLARGEGCAEAGIAAAHDEDVTGLCRRTIFDDVEMGIGFHWLRIGSHRS